MRGSVAAICALALVAGCSEEKKSAKQGVGDYAAELGTDVETARKPAAGGAMAFAEANDVWDFTYAYPAEAGRIAPLRAMFDARQAKAFAELKAEAIDARAEADKEGFDYHPYASGTTWEVVADLPDFLSLSAELYSYEGGAHPNHGFDSLLWDKRAQRGMAPQAVFRSAAELEAAVKQPFCTALNRQRAERRGAPVDPLSGDMFDQCPGIGETTVILGSSNRRTFDRIGFLIGPYVAGPYAEGDFEITLPVSAAIMAVVKPGFRAAFTVTR